MAIFLQLYPRQQLQMFWTLKNYVVDNFCQDIEDKSWLFLGGAYHSYQAVWLSMFYPHPWIAFCSVLAIWGQVNDTTFRSEWRQSGLLNRFFQSDQILCVNLYLMLRYGSKISPKGFYWNPGPPAGSAILTRWRNFGMLNLASRSRSLKVSFQSLYGSFQF